ncbi:MAG: hypothetical protein GY938_13020 [Ketobacter sp.]|nr:hypothetical protein [Ketobacter sp.]
MDPEQNGVQETPNTTAYNVRLSRGVAITIHVENETNSIVKIVSPALNFYGQYGLSYMFQQLTALMGVDLSGIPLEMEDVISQHKDSDRLTFPFRDVQAFQRKFPLIPDNNRRPHLPDLEYMHKRLKFYEEETREIKTAITRAYKAQGHLKQFNDLHPDLPSDPESDPDGLIEEYKQRHENLLFWMAKIADGHADLMWILLGTMDGMAFPFQHIWDYVYMANMAKEHDPDQAAKGYKLGIVKPEGWEGPEGAIMQVLDYFINPNHGPAMPGDDPAITINESVDGSEIKLLGGK